jgi:16S rRNA pseudouridine516 synthase
MPTRRYRLDRFLSSRLSIKRADVRLLLAQGRVQLDHCPAHDIQQPVDQFTHVQCDGQVLQANTPSYIMLHKPPGVVSATKDPRHTTVLDLLPAGRAENLHIVGRLDYNSTGLLLLTNDGRWSRRLSSPESAIGKRYRVRLDKPIAADVIAAFSAGIYFAFEDITTRPAQLAVIDSDTAEVVLQEGRYHQVKRMFGRFQIEVLALHRVAVGRLVLDAGLHEGASRKLTEREVVDIFAA